VKGWVKSFKPKEKGRESEGKKKNSGTKNGLKVFITGGADLEQGGGKKTPGGANWGGKYLKTLRRSPGCMVWKHNTGLSTSLD